MFFEEKYLSCNILLNDTKFHSLVSFAFWDIGKYMYCNCLLSRLWRHKFWNQPSSNQVFFVHDQKVKTKIQMSWERKELLRWNKKHFTPFERVFYLSKWNIFFGRWEPDFKNIQHIVYMIHLRLFLKLTGFCLSGFWLRKNCSDLTKYWIPRREKEGKWHVKNSAIDCYVWEIFGLFSCRWINFEV